MSEIIFGSTLHERFFPVKHRFKYGLYMMKVDVSQLSELSKKHPFFSYNKRNVFYVKDSDYLYPGSDPIQHKLAQVLASSCVDTPIASISLMTIPGTFQPVFKPVSFYLCYGTNGDICALIAEVQNTYKEAHVYPMIASKSSKRGVSFRMDKDFHVSPFFEETGWYAFRVHETADSIEVHIQYHNDETAVFYANFVGRKVPMTVWNSLKTMLLCVWQPWLTYPRIMYQAMILYMIKRLPAFSKPKPRSSRTIRGMELPMIDRLIFRRFDRVLRHIRQGYLRVTLPNSDVIEYGDSKACLRADMHIHHAWFFRSIAMSGEIGLGEAFMNEQWTSSNPAQVIAVLIANKDHIETHFSGVMFRNMANRLLHAMKRNTMKNSQQNIAAHYDVGNDFYRLFLDDTMMYSSAVYYSKDESLESAQRNKVQALSSKLTISSSHHVLEIGSGWGFVATEIARQYGAKVTTLTLSNEQYELTTQRIVSMGLQDLVDVQIMDYRHMQGAFDAIISIEMIEAVGHAYLPTYIQQCYRLLKPGGRFALQAITYPDNAYAAYTKRSDFIRKHIFPGGHLPSYQHLMALVDACPGFRCIDHQDIALSYAKTLRVWRDRFLDRVHDVYDMGFSKTFVRKWVYYLAYCEAAFDAEFLACRQLIFEKHP